MDVQDTILDDITRKQLIWYGHVERMDPMLLPKIRINWKPEGRKKRGRPLRTWKDVKYTGVSEIGLRWANGTIESNGVWKSEGVGRRFNTALHTHTHTHIHTHIYIYI
jgi:hypothetical protein